MSSFPTAYSRISHPFPASHDTYAPAVEPEGGVSIDIDSLAQEMTRNRVDEIRRLMLELTYGEKMSLIDELWLYAPKDVVTKENTAPWLHRWAKGAP